MRTRAWSCMFAMAVGLVLLSAPTFAQPTRCQRLCWAAPKYAPPYCNCFAYREKSPYYYPGGGKAEIHKKNVPRVQRGHAPGLND